MTFLDSQFDLYPRRVSPTAALLLDVENFCLKLDLEQYLKAYCIYPITIKFAVANWQNNTIANLDLFLHQQRYQLIHVPKEKNAADAQILTLGTSLLLQYPHIKEIVIVSHDSIFDYLHNSLISLSCLTYKVYQQSNNIYIQDILNNRTDTIVISQEDCQQNNKNNNLSNNLTGKQSSQSASKKKQAAMSKTSPTQTPKEIVLSNIEMIIKKINPSQANEIPINSLTQEYKKEYKKSLSEVLKNNQLGSSPVKFLKNSCSDKIKINQKNNMYYLSLK